jgi:hypothetical protein
MATQKDPITQKNDNFLDLHQAFIQVHITTSTKRIQQQMKAKWQLSDPKRHQNSIKTTFSIPKDNQQTLNR